MKPIKEQYLVSGFLALFLIHSVQVGVGMLGFQRTVVKVAGYDAWISILISGISLHLIVACMYLLLKRSDGDLMHIHEQLFGKWLGKALSFLVALYFIGLTITVLRSYVEIVQVWVFPDLSTWGITLIAMVFFYYVVSGGFRTVVGLAFFGVIIPIPLFLTLVLPLEYAQFINMLPIMKHSVEELFLGAKEATLSFIGVELLLLFYPFLKNKEDTQKWSQLGVF